MGHRASAPSVGWGLLLAIIGLLLGTYVGHRLGAQHAIVGRPFAFGPTGLNLGALDVTVRVSTNLLGLVGAALGAVFGVSRR